MSSVVPYLDLRTQYLGIKDDIHAAIEHILDTSQFILGEEVKRFEQEFAAYVGAAHGVGVNCGTSALHVALMAAGIGPGDEVITTPFTFVATVAAIRYTGATPVFVDIDLESYTIDPAKIEEKITPRTRAIIPVHLYGQAADMDPILEIARRRGLVVIEDACQAHGTEYKGRRVGGLGDYGAFSFYPGKNLGAYGEGGMVVTNDEPAARKMRMLRDWGQEAKYHHVLPGYNYRMDGFQGAVLRVKLRHLPEWTDARRERAARYDELLAGTPFVTPAEMSYSRHVYHVYAIRTTDRDEVQRMLHANGVQTGIHYPIPVHLQPVHKDLGYRAGDFPASELAADQVLSLPMYPELTFTQVETVVAAL
ncbi:MAG TPA: DegT/DnrJ/EryC1/StrS family aminotransferase, partial [Vicinamibacterales bacterium]|nr:DegT/DnrJ/EryC1/StrS family aminotransferase [Vicinamibacterales bacterium]